MFRSATDESDSPSLFAISGSLRIFKSRKFVHVARSCSSAGFGISGGEQDKGGKILLFNKLTMTDHTAC